MAEPLNQFAQFPKFPNLPLKLRQHIWRLALPPLIIGAQTVQVGI